MDHSSSTIKELSRLLKNGEVSSEELTRSVYEKINEREDKVDAYLLLDEEAALKNAQGIDARIKNGEQLSPLAGIPYGLKDILNTKGIRTTCASKILENYTPIYDAAVFTKLVETGAVMLGKTNMDEFAMGSSTENSAYKKTRNPWDTERVPGGSSGGSAAAVAADMAVFALGTDTGGSIRQPAAFCGIVGLKPTYGLVSRYGLIAFASSLDQIGPMTKTVYDSALVLSAIGGQDKRDSTCLDTKPKDYTIGIDRDIKGMKIGVPIELTGGGAAGGGAIPKGSFSGGGAASQGGSFSGGISPEVMELFKKTLKKLEELGAEVEEVSLPNIEHSLSAYYLIAPAEASSNLARYDGVKFGHRSKAPGDIFQMYSNTRAEGFGSEVKRRIMLGTYALSAGYYDAYYGKANKVRNLIIQDFRTAFNKYDLLVSPTTPTPAFKIGEKTSDPLEMYLSDICTVPVNLAGIPAISIPCGTIESLPVGFQLIGGYLEEEKLLNVSHKLEQAIGFSEKPKF